MLSRRVFLAGTAALAACSARDPAAEAIRRGAAFLWSQRDGIFKSKTYGLMGTGASLTPFVALALPDDPRLVDVLAGLDPLLDADGALGLSGPAADYPVYATSLAISAWRRVKPPGWETRVQKASAWLSAQQFREGWEGHPAHGGFPMGSKLRPTPPNPGHVDLSMTRRAIEALADDPAVRGPARAFVERCRAAGGGFVYSPVETALNKGPAGYGSASCDGALALLALGETPDIAYLRAIHRVDENPGLRGGPMEGFAPAMKGYYRAASAEVFARLGGPDGWRPALVDAVLAEQRDDGSWANPSDLQKEDDPLLATSFALMALRAAMA